MYSYLRWTVLLWYIALYWGLRQKATWALSVCFVRGKEKKKRKNKDMEERKQHLIQKLRSTKGSRAKGSASESKIASSSSNIKPRWRKFQIGWLHFLEERERYLAVRQSTGSEKRSISLPGISRKSKIIDEARNSRRIRVWKMAWNGLRSS